MTNGKNLKINPLPIVLLTDVSLNLIKKGLWFTLCYFIKFNSKPIYEYQKIELLHGSISKKLDTKGHCNGHKKIIGRLWSTNYGTRTEWEASKKVQNVFIMVAQIFDQKKNPGNTESSNMASYVLSSLALKLYCQTHILQIQKEVKIALNGDFSIWIFKT